MAGWVSMQRSCKLSRFGGELLSRSRGNESAATDADRTPARLFLRSARWAASVLTWIACAASRPPCGQGEVSRPGGDATLSQGDPTRIAREAMVQEQIAGRGVKNAAVLAAMGRVPRHKFMPEAVRRFAYDDRPVPTMVSATKQQNSMQVAGW